MAICLSALAVWCGAAAQETVPLRFQGSDAKRFMARLIGETEKIVDAAQIPAAELSSQVVVGFTVDETGNVTQWRFLDGRFIGRGAKGEGVVRVRFYIEPDGKITIGEVIKSPDEKLSREMIRVIRSSKGKWTPRKVRGVPQRTAYEYGVNFLGMAE